MSRKPLVFTINRNSIMIPSLALSVQMKSSSINLPNFFVCRDSNCSDGRWCLTQNTCLVAKRSPIADVLFQRKMDQYPSAVGCAGVVLVLPRSAFYGECFEYLPSPCPHAGGHNQGNKHFPHNFFLAPA